MSNRTRKAPVRNGTESPDSSTSPAAAEANTVSNTNSSISRFLRENSIAAKKLTLPDILPVIGFRHAKGFIDKIERFVEAHYGDASSVLTIVTFAGCQITVQNPTLETARNGFGWYFLLSSFMKLFMRWAWDVPSHASDCEDYHFTGALLCYTGLELFDQLPLPDGSIYNVALDVDGARNYVSVIPKYRVYTSWMDPILSCYFLSNYVSETLCKKYLK